MLDAPIYPPARAFEQPAATPRNLDTATTSIADLLAIPAAKAILEKELPGLQMRIGNEALKPHLGNFSLRSLVQFGVFKPAELDRVDVQLRALPKSAASAS